MGYRIGMGSSNMIVNLLRAGGINDSFDFLRVAKERGDAHSVTPPELRN